jgi:hypothetical protein
MARRKRVAPPPLLLRRSRLQLSFWIPQKTRNPVDVPLKKETMLENIYRASLRQN